MNKAHLEAQLATITQQLDAINAAEQAAAIAARKAFVMEYEYSVAWPHPAQFRIERQVTADCAERLAAFAVDHGIDAPKPFVGGMTYSLLEGGYALGGGGSIVVQFTDDRRAFEPDPIAADVVASLRAGIVPDSIKRP